MRLNVILFVQISLEIRPLSSKNYISKWFVLITWLDDNNDSDEMADLNQSLKDYLSRAQKKDTVGVSDSTSRYFTGWFDKESVSEEKVGGESSNGWFTDAQKDPLLPSLVRSQINLHCCLVAYNKYCNLLVVENSK